MIHKQTHADQRERLMLLTLSITPQIISFFKFKIVVGAVVIKNVIPAFYNLLTVLIKLCLYEVILLGKHG